MKKYKHLNEYISNIETKKATTFKAASYENQIWFFVLGLITSTYITMISAMSMYLIILNISFFLSIVATHLQNNLTDEVKDNSAKDDRSKDNTPPSNYKMLISLFRLVTCTTSITLSSYQIFYKILNIQSFFLGAPTSLLLTILFVYYLSSIFNKKEDLIWLGKFYRDNTLASLKKESANQLLKTLNDKKISDSNIILAIKQEIIKNNNLNFKKNKSKSLFYKVNSKYKTALLATLFELRLDTNTNTQESKWYNSLKNYIKDNKILFLCESVFILCFAYIISPYSFTDKLYFLYPFLNKYLIILKGSFAPWLTLVLLFITAIICCHFAIHYLRQKASAGSAVTEPEENTTNPLKNNPIASIWHGMIAFFRWFYKSGIDSPIIMSIYAFLFFGTIVDLYVPFLPIAWHSFNIQVMLGLVNMQHTAFWFAAMITGFFLGKVFLLANYLVNNRSNLYHSSTSDESKIITITTIVLIICFSFIEAGSPAILSHIGSWLVFNLVTWNIKPAVLLLDLVFNKDESFIYSIFTSTAAILSLKKISATNYKSISIVITASLAFMSFFEIISVNTLFLTTLIIFNNPKLLNDAWELISNGLVSVINFPLKVIAIPMLHVYIIALIKIFSFNSMHETITTINAKATEIDIKWSKFNQRVSKFINKNAKLFVSLFTLIISALSLSNVWTCPILVYIATSIPFITIPLNAFSMISISLATIILSCSKHDFNFPPTTTHSFNSNRKQLIVAKGDSQKNTDNTPQQFEPPPLQTNLK